MTVDVVLPAGLAPWRKSKLSPVRCEGAIAQLEEHLLCKQGVTSSSLVSSTISDLRKLRS